MVAAPTKARAKSATAGLLNSRKHLCHDSFAAIMRWKTGDGEFDLGWHLTRSALHSLAQFEGFHGLEPHPCKPESAANLAIQEDPNPTCDRKQTIFTWLEEWDDSD